MRTHSSYELLKEVTFLVKLILHALGFSAVYAPNGCPTAYPTQIPAIP